MTQHEDAVRRLLADARHDAPVPDEVVARLDTTLAGLVAERDASAPEPSPAPVIDLAARRRRRMTQFVAAAAVVVVAGVGVNQLQPFGTSSPSSDTAGASLDSTQPQADEKADEKNFDSGRDNLDAAPRGGKSAPESSAELDTQSAARAAPDLSSDMDDAQILGAVGRLPMDRATLSWRQTRGCEATRAARQGTWITVWWDGERAVARWRPGDDPDRVEVRLCDGSLARVVPLD
ncbi:MAG: hypothetical protein ACI379_05555 [Nocardioides sp.]|uniref:hypothetical protein n=1 Tax=Nocardioides sp. TaxID=35761 RepID=UPI003F10FE6E